VTDADRNQILALYDQHSLTQRQIAAVVGVSKGAVYKIVGKYRTTNSESASVSAADLTDEQRWHNKKDPRTAEAAEFIRHARAYLLWNRDAPLWYIAKHLNTGQETCIEYIREAVESDGWPKPSRAAPTQPVPMPPDPFGEAEAPEPKPVATSATTRVPPVTRTTGYPENAGCGVQLGAAPTPYRGVINYRDKGHIVTAWYGPWRADRLQADQDATDELHRPTAPRVAGAR
jgi:hypothetical protein